MQRLCLCWLLLWTGVAGLARAETSGRAAAGFGAAMESSEPSPIFITEEPRMALAPNSTVYVTESSKLDFDLFRYGVYWYAHEDGRWFRSRTYRGPFRLIEVKYVPRAILSMPARHWRHPHGVSLGARRQAAAVVQERHRRARGR